VRYLRSTVLVATVQVLAIHAVAALEGTGRGEEDQLEVPSFVSVRSTYQPSDVQLLDRHGAVIHELRVDARRRRLAWTPLELISPALQAAVIASEDRRFYRHGGVDGLALLDALARRLTGGPLRGASTISMQVAALLDPHTASRSNGRSIGEKWRQMRRAWALERRWSKTEILEAYLNLVTFRGELQGAAAAANVLFGKAPHGITESEALVLAVLVRAPNARPDTVQRRTVRLRDVLPPEGPERSNDPQLAASVTQALSAPPGTAARAVLAPHVARRLLRTTPPFGSATSTLDIDTQRAAGDTLRRQLLALRERRVADGAVLVVENATGDVLAYVAGSGTLSRAPHVDGIRARRQAGSALKPFLYGLAIEQRLVTAASRLEDTPLELPVTGGLYRPQNYDEQFHGLVTLRTALSSSLNVPAVRLLELVGGTPFVEHLRRLGFEGVARSGDYYGPALALGSADVSLWEMAGAYRALASGGMWSALRLSHDEAVPPPLRIYSAATAFIISDMLADRDGRSVTFGLESPLGTRFWSAVKTGTSKDMRDNWCIGYSDRYTVAVWVGNFSGRPMQDVSGVTGAAPVWLELMNWLHRDLPSAPSEPPPNVVARPVRFTDAVLPERSEWFLVGTEPGVSTIEPMRARARIVRPVSGTIIANDPDIPPAQQRMMFEARDAREAAIWMLDGQRLGSAAGQLMWPPQPGRHQLQLLDAASSRVLDEVTFVVRGQGSGN